MVRLPGLRMEVPLNKIITALAAVALIASPFAASARDFDGGRGGGHYEGGRGGGERGGHGFGGDRDYRGDRGDRGGYAGAALLGGLALGALIGGSYNSYNATPYGYGNGNGYGYGYAPNQSCSQWVWNPRAGRYVWANVC